MTNNLRQLDDPDEYDAMKKSLMHHVTYELDDGLDGLARASGALCAALRSVVTALEGAPSQRLARVIGLQRGNDASISPTRRSTRRAPTGDSGVTRAGSASVLSCRYAGMPFRSVCRGDESWRDRAVLQELAKSGQDP